jgi:hypothetical protein
VCHGAIRNGGSTVCCTSGQLKSAEVKLLRLVPQDGGKLHRATSDRAGMCRLNCIGGSRQVHITGSCVSRVGESSLIFKVEILAWSIRGPGLSGAAFLRTESSSSSPPSCTSNEFRRHRRSNWMEAMQGREWVLSSSNMATRSPPLHPLNRSNPPATPAAQDPCLEVPEPNCKSRSLLAIIRGRPLHVYCRGEN